MGDEEGGSWVQRHGFFDAGMEVWEARQVGFCEDAPTPAHFSRKLLLVFGYLLWVLQQLCHCPLDGCVAQCKERK
ncbi:hypothetical protein ACLOJK_013580 [Asimina triloba]